MLSLNSCLVSYHNISRRKVVSNSRNENILYNKSHGYFLSTKTSAAYSCLSLKNGGSSMLANGVGVGERDGLIIVDHGSRRRESNLMLNEFVEMFRDKTGYKIVEPAHMELALPSIADAFGACIKQGADRVIISPFFLFPGRHWHQDIPSLAAEAAEKHPEVSYLITSPLGNHELLVDVVNDRIKHCLSHIGGQAGECSICFGSGKCRFYSSTRIDAF